MEPLRGSDGHPKGGASAAREAPVFAGTITAPVAVTCTR